MENVDPVLVAIYFGPMLVVSLLSVWFFYDEYKSGRSVTLFDLFLAVGLASMPVVNLMAAIMGFLYFMKEWGSKIIIFQGRGRRY